MQEPVFKKCVKIDCDKKLVTEHRWSRFSKAEKAKLGELGYARHAAFGLCQPHRRELPPDEALPSVDEMERRRETLKLWDEMQEAPDPIAALAEELDRTPGHVKRYLQAIGAPNIPDRRIDPRSVERDYQISEIRFLRSAGQGVAEIARALGWTAEQLVMRVHYWRLQGDCDFDFLDDWKAVDCEEAWTSEEWMTRARQSQRAFNRAA